MFFHNLKNKCLCYEHIRFVYETVYRLLMGKKATFRSMYNQEKTYLKMRSATYQTSYNPNEIL